MHKTLKEAFSDYIIFLKVGNFCEAYDNDAKIISYLFNYKLRKLNDTLNCVFPLVAINKVLSVLDRKSINYIVIDKAHNYEEEIKQNYKRKNKYEETLNEALKYTEKIDRIEKIKNHLMLDDKYLLDIERLLYEQK